MSVEAKVKGFVQERFVRDGADISTTHSLLDSGLIDSAGIFDLVSYLEKEFSIEVLDEEIVPENFETVGSIASFVDEKRG